LYHENGEISAVQNFAVDKLHGLRTTYYSNGQISAVENWINDLCTPVEFWDEKGNQLMKDGTGKTVMRFLLVDYELYYENGKFIKEVKIRKATYMGFIPKNDSE
jgi:antitoxin component YwqK of YwqJK toxin-antitoxin module